MPKFVINATVLLLLIAILPMPYGYYTLLRTIVTGVSVWVVVISHDNRDNHLVLLYVIIAILFNPIIPVYLTKEIWVIIDMICAIILLFTKDNIVDENK